MESEILTILLFILSVAIAAVIVSDTSKKDKLAARKRDKKREAKRGRKA